MKLNPGISKIAKKDLQKILDPDVLMALCQKLKQDRGKHTNTKKCQDNQTIQMKTPSTVDTTLKRRGSAISKSIRPQSRSKNKIRPTFSQQTSLTNQIAVTKLIQQSNQQRQQSVKNQLGGQTPALNRKVLTDRAVYYGPVQLPYLHSSDAISSLYERSKANQKGNAQALINPPPSISPTLLTNVKNLYLYYTSLDSLRQLGTGWSNLKSLTVMCSFLLRDLSGLSIFPSLQYLFVPYNNISQISDIMYHTTLRCVDLHDNKIDLIDQIQYLYTVSNLQWVDISQNPITLKKQKYRIICENLGNKIQLQDNNKLTQYQLQQNDLDYEFYSYENMQVSNYLVKQINQQILKQEIKIGQAWRSAQQKIHNPKCQQSPQADIQILTAFNQFTDEDQYMEQSNASNLNDGLKLRVTNLNQYVNSDINLGPLKKYFYNKVCPQSKPQKKLGINLAEQHGQTSETITKKFALTQKLAHATSEQKQKPRLASVSLKKRFGKMSLPKNNNFASTASSVLNNHRPKEQLISDLNTIALNSGIKFMTKRKLLQKVSQQRSNKF